MIAGLSRIGSLALAAACASTASAATTWYVDLSAAPPGSGTQAAPYASIQFAIAQASTVDGDTVLVAPGTYVETVDYLSKDIVVKSSGGPLVTTIHAVTGAPSVVTLGKISTLEGFTVSRTGATAGQVGVTNTLSGELGTIRRCIIRGHDYGVSNGYDCSYQQCTITQNRIGLVDTGLAIQFVQDSIVRGNTQWDLFVTTFGGFFIRYSDVSTFSISGCDGSTCTGVLDLDPRFWDAGAHDFHLRPDSPCIDTGDPAAPLDPDGSRTDVGALTFDPAYAPGTAQSCFGNEDECPCGNAGSGAGGCDIAQGTGGIVLTVMNFTPNGSGGGTVQLVGSGYPVASQPGVTLIRSPSAEFPPVVFGDGLRCIAVPTVRINATLASGGSSLSPVSHGAGAGTFHYQVWVRNQPAGFCTPDAFNLSNAVSIVW